MSAREITSADVRAGRVAPKIIHRGRSRIAAGGAPVEVPPGLQTNALTLAQHQAAQGKQPLTLDEAIRVGHRPDEIAAHFAIQEAYGPTLALESARARGYEGEGCRQCGNFTLLRAGTCLVCETCGSTSGCS